jgi:regulator of protease activity HflC (stomatin/prohibitin superfamily)
VADEVIIKSTHRGLRYEDGRLTGVLEAGRYEVSERRPGRRGGRRPVVEIIMVDMRERELTIKGQEILTADKVAIRVSILTQFQVLDPVAAVEKVVAYEDRLYSDVQLAARRALASMTLEQILTSRNQLSEDILSDVTDAAAGYGVKVLRADVKDLIFPGNLQEIMNRVLTAERLSQAQLIEARTKAEREAIEARARSEVEQMTAQSQATVQNIRAQADAAALRVQAEAAAVYVGNAALLRVRELETLSRLSANPGARIYIGFDKHLDPPPIAGD